MSLIEEALRRVQDPLLKKMSGANPAEGTGESAAPIHPWPAHPQRRALGSPVILSRAAGIGLLALAVLGLAWMSKQLSPANADLRPAGGVPVAQAQARTQREGFHLEGLVYGADTAYAVINGEVLEPGDHIGSHQLTGIDAKTAVLTDARGNSVSLSLNP